MLIKIFWTFATKVSQLFARVRSTENWTSMSQTKINDFAVRARKHALSETMANSAKEYGGGKEIYLSVWKVRGVRPTQPFFLQTKMTDFPNILYTFTREIPTLSYTLGPEVKVHLSSGNSSHRPLKGVRWFSNRTGTSVDWLDQWQNDKLGTGSRV